ncbi:hypothetical protein B0J11DRAFT_572176 [Dendryphion nanum]|uniref:Uncharacterized protein n=1 Tax=Dendryphion nanum TaxID=256645 RepID=A0A9P9ICV6_9PLEO|nr:hypothetical protein B0J11DRAFT_572176 [Dendryphion nanum]
MSRHGKDLRGPNASDYDSYRPLYHGSSRRGRDRSREHQSRSPMRDDSRRRRVRWSRSPRREESRREIGRRSRSSTRRRSRSRRWSPSPAQQRSRRRRSKSVTPIHYDSYRPGGTSNTNRRNRSRRREDLRRQRYSRSRSLMRRRSRSPVRRRSRSPVRRRSRSPVRRRSRSPVRRRSRSPVRKRSISSTPLHSIFRREARKTAREHSPTREKSQLESTAKPQSPLPLHNSPAPMDSSRSSLKAAKTTVSTPQAAVRKLISDKQTQVKEKDIILIESSPPIIIKDEEPEADAPMLQEQQDFDDDYMFNTAMADNSIVDKDVTTAVVDAYDSLFLAKGTRWMIYSMMSTKVILTFLPGFSSAFLLLLFYAFCDEGMGRKESDKQISTQSCRKIESELSNIVTDYELITRNSVYNTL